MKRIIHLVTTLAIGGSLPAYAQSPTIRLPQTARPPQVTDYLAGRPVQGELELAGFRQRDPNDGDDVSQSTTAYLSYDSRNLYVAFVCRDREPASLRARLSKRDAIGQDDVVTVFLDTFGDHQRSYVFAANPLGVQLDAVTREGQDDDLSYDTVWSSDGRLTGDGFVVLLTIPFKSLRLPVDHTQRWAIALSRTIPRNSEQSFWPYITRRVEGFAQQFAAVEGLEHITAGLNTEVIPYTAVTQAHLRDKVSGSDVSASERRFGFDSKFVVRNALSLDIAINPDFSQVESDQPQVAVNQRFELFYPEKRPFFLENAPLFKYPAIPATRSLPELLFFSRRVIDPGIGARLTGKVGQWSIGSLIANDRVSGPPGTPGTPMTPGTPGPSAVAAVGRAQREFQNQSTVGVMLTSREIGDGFNRVAAADFRLKLNPRWVLLGQAVGSDSRSREGVHTSGPAYNLALLRNTRTFLYSLFYSDRSPGFRADLGFVARTDIRQIEQYWEYRRRPRVGPVTAFGPNSYVRLNWNREGRLQEWVVRFPFEMQLKGRTNIFVRRVESSELFGGVDLRERFQTVNVTTEWLKWLAVTEGVEWGTLPNFFPAAGALPYTANSRNVSLTLTFRPTPRMKVEQTYLYNGLRTRGALIFDNHISRSTFNFQFTRFLSLRTIVDYNAVLPDPALVKLAYAKRFGFDALASYQLGPGTALYFGYTSSFRNPDPSGDGVGGVLSDPAATRAGGAPTIRIGQQLFVKVSYLFRL